LNKYNIQSENDTTLEQNLLWRRRQPLYKTSVNSSCTSLDSLNKSFHVSDEENTENKYQYQFECPNAMAANECKIVNVELNEKLAKLRNHFT